MLEALKSLSTFFTDNNLRTRRNLRGDIERRSLAINEQYVDCLRVVMDVSKGDLYHRVCMLSLNCLCGNNVLPMTI